jgi:hypothetical protein
MSSLTFNVDSGIVEHDDGMTELKRCSRGHSNEAVATHSESGAVNGNANTGERSTDEAEEFLSWIAARSPRIQSWKSAYAIER